VILNLKESVWESVRTSEMQSHKKIFVEHYVERPVHLETLSLLNCAREYHVKCGRWVQRKKSAVVRVFPRNFLALDSDYESLKKRCILNVPWRTIEELNVGEEVLKEKLDSVLYTWNDTEDRDVVFESSDSECDNHSDHDGDEEDMEDWTYVSKLNSRKMTKGVHKPGSNDHYQWDYASEKYDLAEVYEIWNSLKTDKVENDVEIIDYSLLSKDQLKAFEHFSVLVNDCSKNVGWSRGRVFIVQGRAGYGKSFLLKAMTVLL